MSSGVDWWMHVPASGLEDARPRERIGGCRSVYLMLVWYPSNLAGHMFRTSFRIAGTCYSQLTTMPAYGLRIGFSRVFSTHRVPTVFAAVNSDRGDVRRNGAMSQNILITYASVFRVVQSARREPDPNSAYSCDSRSAAAYACIHIWNGHGCQS